MEQILVEGCQPHICAQLQLGANFALTAKYYSPRDTSSANHIENPSAGTRENQTNAGGPVHRCSVLVGDKIASGAKRITR